MRAGRALRDVADRNAYKKDHLPSTETASRLCNQLYGWKSRLGPAIPSGAGGKSRAANGTKACNTVSDPQFKDATRPTLKDIAERSDLTVASVSRILRNKGNWSPHTREKVNRVAEEMRSQKTQTIGVMFAAPTSYFSLVMAGIQQGLAERDYLSLTLWGWRRMSGPSREMSDSQREFRWIHRLIEHRVDGVILGPVDPEAGEKQLIEIREHGLDVVLVDFDIAGVDADYVASDDVAGGRRATRYLLDMGHRRLGCVVASSMWPPIVRRMQGCRAEVREQSDASLEIYECSTGSFEDGERAGAILDGPNRPTALLATNDVVAVGLYRAAAARGLRIPEDLSIIGFGPSFPPGVFAPPLTIMDQHPEQIGRMAAARMVDLQRQTSKLEALPERILVPPDLLEGGSVAPPPAD